MSIRSRKISVLFLLVMSLSSFIFAQTTNSVAAPSVLSPTIQRLGGLPPGDAVITGDVTITAGSTNESGTIRIVTQDVTNTSESYSTPTTSRLIIFANGIAAERTNATLQVVPFGRMLSARTPLSPLTFLAAKLADPTVQVEDLGVATAADQTTHHIQTSNAWANDKIHAPYQDFTICDIWLDPLTSLPQAVSYRQRAGLGAVPWLAVRIEYDDYRPISGLLYPFHITKLVNGTKWADIHITSVTLNTGVAASEFSLK